MARVRSTSPARGGLPEGPLSEGHLPEGPQWSYEVDWAGVALTADVDAGVLTLRTVEGRDVTSRFPEFAPLAATVADGLFEGEAVMLDAGVPSSSTLAERLRVADPRRARALARARPGVLMVHDVLRLYGVPLGARTLAERRAVLARLDLAGAERVQVSPAYDDGPALLAGVAAQGLPGVVARPHDRAGDLRAAAVRVRVAPDVEPVGRGSPA